MHDLTETVTELEDASRIDGVFKEQATSTVEQVRHDARLVELHFNAYEILYGAITNDSILVLPSLSS